MSLILFLKIPQKGKVKTRLAARVGEEKALEIYEGLLRHTLEVAMELPLRRLIFFSGDRSSWQPDWLQEDAFLFFPQQGSDLGERMSHAFRQALSLHPQEPAVLVGSDIPDLSPDILDFAFRQMKPDAAADSADVVFGPARDGGYYLLGLQPALVQREDCLNALFENKRWSHDRVLQDALDALKPFDLKIAFTKQLEDLDE